jgi:cyclic dehypoxanthinyl futalosine synthase
MPTHRTGEGLPFEWYLDLLRFIRKGNYPSDSHSRLQPARDLGLSPGLQDAAARMSAAAAGGRAGDDSRRRRRDPRRARPRQIGQGKAAQPEWLAVMRAAHELGMKTSCTMMFGHIETVAERIEHMRVLRDLQDETGGFTAFIHWPFQPAGTPLGRWKNRPRKRPIPVWSAAAIPDGEHLCLADANEYLRMLAIARLYFDNIPNIQSSWVTMGPEDRPTGVVLWRQRHGLGHDGGERRFRRLGTTYRLNEPRSAA